MSLERAPTVGIMGRMYIPRTEEGVRRLQLPGSSSWVNQWSHPLDGLLQNLAFAFLHLCVCKSCTVASQSWFSSTKSQPALIANSHMWKYIWWWLVVSMKSTRNKQDYGSDKKLLNTCASRITLAVCDTNF